ncbi:class I SAM-dependent DNA methyltransferase [Streptomyces sp. NBC_00370]|uniref:class I SAM-dependent DNA methyltransferase n=1 Tax=Streptomyces sp. NBC_00370 TaxID=2975728 RepID=UPI002E256BFE
MTDARHLLTTRDSYDAAAGRYATLFRDALAGATLDRAMLGAFAEFVLAGGGGPVADLGCGPGRLSGYLRDLGLDVFGIDLSPAMVALAREAHPGLRFDEGTMTALDLQDGALGGIVAWYSVIHTPPGELSLIFAEFGRVLAPGGHLLLGFFHADDETSEQPQEFDHAVATGYRWSAGRLAELLGPHGLVEVFRLVRAPGEGERFLQGCLLVRKP